MFYFHNQYIDDNINEYEDVLIVNRYQSIGDEMENYNMDDLDNLSYSSYNVDSHSHHSSQSHCKKSGIFLKFYFYLKA